MASCAVSAAICIVNNIILNIKAAKSNKADCQVLGSHVNSIGVLLNDLAKDAHNLPDSAEPTLRNLVESLGRAEKLVEKCASRSAFGSFMTSRDTKEEFNQVKSHLILSLTSLDALNLKVLTQTSVTVQQVKTNLEGMRLETNEGMGAMAEQMRMHAAMQDAKMDDMRAMLAAFMARSGGANMQEVVHGLAGDLQHAQASNNAAEAQMLQQILQQVSAMSGNANELAALKAEMAELRAAAGSGAGAGAFPGIPGGPAASAGWESANVGGAAPGGSYPAGGGFDAVPGSFGGGMPGYGAPAPAYGGGGFPAGGGFDAMPPGGGYGAPGGYAAPGAAPGGYGGYPQQPYGQPGYAPPGYGYPQGYQ